MTQIKWTKDAGVYVSDCNAFRIRKDGKTFVLREGRKIVGHGKLGELQTVAQNLRNHSFLSDRVKPDKMKAWRPNAFKIEGIEGNAGVFAPGTDGIICAHKGENYSTEPAAVAMSLPAGSRRQLRKKLHAMGRRDLVLASIPARS